MKKIKILPSILMLIACVAILGVGVFAIAPTQNTISGSITINASNTPVSIELFIDNVSQGDPVDVRSGKTFDIGALEFNTSGVNTVSEVKNRKVTLKVTNLSTTQSLGVYFYKNDTELVDGMADVQNIMLEEPVYANNSEDRIATAYFTPYYYIGVNDGNTTTNGTDDFEFDTVEMNINFECFQLFNESKSYDFNYQLNIEPYVGNVGNSDLVTTEPVWNEVDYSADFSDMDTSDVSVRLIKISEDVTTIPSCAFCENSTEGSHIVVVPSSVKNFKTYYDMGNVLAPFGDLDDLKAISVNANVGIEDGADIWGGGWLMAETIVLNINVPDKICDFASVLRVELSNNITSIGNSAFSSCSSLTSIEIPSSVTSIGDSAFSGCSSLTSIEIPSGVTSISSSTFYSCSSLTSIEIPSGVTSIGDYAFYSCSSLTSIEIPSGVTNIGNRAFYNCSSLTSIEIPSGVTSIGSLAFSDCSNLTSIEIPSGVTSIGSSAFLGCGKLESITIKSGLDLGSAYSLPTLTKTGYTFKGWYDNAEGTGSPVTQISANKYTADTTYYAVWTQN